jgi:hypothetical protein
MEQREDNPQRCKGKFGSLTQTGVEDNESFEGSKEGDHGFMHKPELPQNQGSGAKDQISIFFKIKLNNEKTLSTGVNEDITFQIWKPRSRNPIVKINKTRPEAIKTIDE